MQNVTMTPCYHKNSSISEQIRMESIYTIQDCFFDERTREHCRVMYNVNIKESNHVTRWRKTITMLVSGGR